METWSAHLLFSQASQKLGPDAARSLRDYAVGLEEHDLPVIFNLGHLSQITGIDPQLLRETVRRKREAANYRMYAVKKRSGGRRFIHSVTGGLSRIQKFLNEEVLQKMAPHPCSYAFHPRGGIRACAAKHCNARWLFQYDLKDFFYDVTEIDVYRVFRAAGYRELLSFELARLCTTTHLPRHLKRLLWRELRHRRKFNDEGDLTRLPYAFEGGIVGVLPQGAPTSPMLANLAASRLDTNLAALARNNGLLYTRYADDLSFSAPEDPAGTIGSIHREIVGQIRRSGFIENTEKSRIAGPGSRKVVLGLLVDGPEPRLSKAMYRRIDRHLHAAAKFGIEAVASHECFDSAYGFCNHLRGLVAFVKDVDVPRWEDFSARLASISLPWSG